MEIALIVFLVLSVGIYLFSSVVNEVKLIVEKKDGTRLTTRIVQILLIVGILYFVYINL